MRATASRCLTAPTPFKEGRSIVEFVAMVIFTLTLTACTKGPNYVEPAAPVPEKFKEAAPGWKVAHPRDDCDRGDWWDIYQDSELSCLLERVDVSNQNIRVAAAQYRQACSLLSQARAAYFPTMTGNMSALRQKNSFGGFTTGSGGTSVTTTATTITTLGTDTSNLNTNYTPGITASWVPDLWGTVRRTVEANKASAQVSKAQLAAVRLSMQTTLVQTYFELRYVDANQKMLDDTVRDYRIALALTKNRYKAGVSYSLDVAQAETQLSTAEAQAIENRVNRALYEHAIAVLIGEAPACFSLIPRSWNVKLPLIPSQIPCELLERRPDIAAAERQVAASNAQIGVAIAAFYPNLTLTGSYGYSSPGLGNLISVPTKYWSLGFNLAETLFDGGLRLAALESANANYDQTVASYRQTVLTAFQGVEDNLSTLRILKKELIKQQEVMTNAEKVLNISMNQYKAGTQQYSVVVQAQISLFAARKTYIDLRSRLMVTSAALISALGGGWDKAQICRVCK